MPAESLDYDYFARLYAGSGDPWDFETSDYEHGKYRDTLAQLGGERFERALEIGCSIGVLTAMLAPLCGHLLSVDINPLALERARRRCAGLPGVRFEQMAVPAGFPEGRFDLVLVSEVAYYWSDDDLALAVDKVARAASGGGIVELVHFLPPVSDYPRDGDAVHEYVLADRRFQRLRAVRAERYRIDTFRVS